MTVLKEAHSEPFLVAAGKTIEFKETGEFVRCLSSDGDIEISFNRGGGRSFFASGIARRAQKGSVYQSFELHNNGDSDVEGVITFGYGDVEDNRLQASGELTIINPSGEELRVSDASVWSRINDVRNELIELGKKPNVDLTNAVYASVTNSALTLVTALANTNGIKIHQGAIVAGNVGADARILLDGTNVIIGNDGVFTGATQYAQKIENYLLPAGVSLSISSGDNDANVYCWYEVLV